MKYNEIKAKFENDHMKSEENRRKLEEEITFLIKSKERLEV